MPVRAVQFDEVSVRIDVGGVIHEVMWADIPGNGWNQNRLNKMADGLQALLDNRTFQGDLPFDDPERTWTAGEFISAYPEGTRFLDGDTIVDRSVAVTSIFMHASGLYPVVRLERLR